MSALFFFFKKAHVTKKTSSRQTTSRPDDKKNPDLAISELFLIKNPVYAQEPFDEESEQFQEKTLQLLVPNSKRLGGYTQMGVLFSSKKHTPLKDPKKRYTVSLKKALGRRLFLLGKT